MAALGPPARSHLRPGPLRLAGLIAAGIVLLAVLPRLGAMALFNQAQLDRVQGRLRPDLYRQAVTLAPDDAHMRRQAGQALLEAGDPTQAAAVLRPLIDTPAPDPQIGDLALTALVADGQADRAVQLYNALHPAPTLAPPLAARLVRDYRAQHPGDPLVAPLPAILAAALGANPAGGEFGLLRPALQPPDFWATPPGARVGRVLEWQAGLPLPDAQPPVLATPPAPPPAVATAPVVAAVAQLLKASPAQVRLGPNLVPDGDFEQVVDGLPAGWGASLMSTGDPWNLALFVVGADPVRAFAGRYALRVDGIALDGRADREAARAGVLHPAISLTAGQAYALSFVYRTHDAADNAAGLWVGADPQVLWAGEKFFPASPDRWRRVTVVATNRSATAQTITPLLRNWGTGTVWFDNFAIHAVSAPGDLSGVAPLLLIGDAVP